MENASHPVTISVSADGEDFTYAPSVLHVNKGDTVVWNSPDGPFTVEFKEGTPGNDIHVHGEPQRGQWESAPFAILGTAASGHYHYAVAIALNADKFQAPVRGRVGLDAACPEIIVN